MAGNTLRNGRYAMVIEKDGTISYFENESNPGQVTVRESNSQILAHWC